MLEMKVW